MVGDVHPPNRSTHTEEDVTCLTYATLGCAEQAVGREAISKICEALMDGRALADLVVKLGLWRLPHRTLAYIFEILDLPSLRNFAMGRSDTGTGLEVGNVGGSQTCSAR